MRWMGVAVLLVAMAVVTTGCATKVIRKEPAEVVDLSGRWNDTDSRMVTEEMIKTCFEGNWLSEFNKDKGRDPVVIIGTILNRSHEHINSMVFVQDLEQALVNSGKAKFVADKQAREEVREERQDQQLNSSPETRAKLVQETGADYMLQGSINSIKDETRGQYVILFQINLELVNLTTNEKTWIGQKKVKKLVKYPKYSM